MEGVAPGMRIDGRVAKACVLDDIDGAALIVSSLVRAPLTQKQFDALVSLVSNIGRTAFENSGMVELINAGSLAEAAGRFTDFVAGNTRRFSDFTRLMKRARKEREWFLEGVAPLPGLPEHTVKLTFETTFAASVAAPSEEEATRQVETIARDLGISGTVVRSEVLA